MVTGGAKGIVKAITVALAQEGAKVVINYNSSNEAAENVVNELGKDGHDVNAV
ncbi:SDR family NAD(P)-dependent oxidoreductase, partial [Bacillus cereus]|nr:SDR family NAD(P)-dependent oxidoreductase [Bacillus cereus]